MFKKPFNLGQSHKVSGADRKKLRRALEKAYGVSEDGLEAILPAKAGELECIKLASPSRVVLYLHDGSPILMDPNGKGDYAPTCFALWRWPDLLPRVYVKHPAVSRYLVGGADLMLPGVALPAEGLPAFQRDQLLAVCSPGNPAPVAVGAAVMDSGDAAARIRGQAPGGCRGKLVEVMQHYGDYLWADVGGRAVPNAGFLADGVVPPGVASVEATLNGDFGDQSDDEGADAAAAAAGPQDGEGAPADAAAERMAGLGLDGAGGGASGQSGEASTSGSGAGAAAGGGEAEAAVDMDALLESVLLQALTKSVKDGDLPLNSGVLWNSHMQPQRPAGSTLDVKKTKHKKMSKFLQAYAKSGLLTCKEDKHSGDVIVTAVNRKCPLLLDFRPYKASSTAAAESAGATSSAPEAAAGGSAGASAADAAGACSQSQLLIEEVYKAGRELRPIFEELKLKWPRRAIHGRRGGGRGVRLRQGGRAGRPRARAAVRQPHAAAQPAAVRCAFQGLHQEGRDLPHAPGQVGAARGLHAAHAPAVPPQPRRVPGGAQGRAARRGHQHREAAGQQARDQDHRAGGVPGGPRGGGGRVPAQVRVQHQCGGPAGQEQRARGGAAGLVPREGRRLPHDAVRHPQEVLPGQDGLMMAMARCRG